MKRFFTFTLVALFSVFLISSCNNKSTEDMLVGTWILKKSELKNWDDLKKTIEEWGLDPEEFKQEFESTNDEQMQLNEDHTAVMSGDEEAGKWTYDKDKNAILLESPNGSKFTFNIQSISDKELVVLVSNTEDGMTVEFLWTFEKQK